MRRVLSVGADRTVFEEESATRRRQRAYTERLGELHVLSVCDGPASAERDGKLTLYAVPSRAVFFEALSRRLQVPYRVAGIVRKHNIDVVSVQDPFEIGLAALIGSWGTGVKLHVQVHTDFLSPEYARLSLVNRIRVLIAGFVLRRASRIRVVSERIKVSIQKKYRITAPITVLPIFAEVERIKQVSSSEELTGRFAQYTTKLLVVSRLELEKNVALALRSFAKSADNDTCLIVVGDGRERSALESLAGQLGLRDRVFFEGMQDATTYYALADLVLVPSKYEGYGLVIVEALARGVPVLSTDVGIAREAGAIIASEGTFAEALREWFKSGPRKGELKSYPYKSFAEYVRAYCEDILAATR